MSTSLPSLQKRVAPVRLHLGVPNCRHDAILRRSRDTAPGKARPSAAELCRAAEPRATTLTISALQVLHLALVEPDAEWWPLLVLSSRTAAPQTCQACIRSESLQLCLLLLSDCSCFASVPKSLLLCHNRLPKNVVCCSSTARAFSSRTSWARHHAAEATTTEAMASCQQSSLGKHTDSTWQRSACLVDM